MSLAAEHRTAEPTTLIILFFWMVMLVAAALFGAVVSAPKYVEHIRLKEQVRRQQFELSALEKSVDHYRRIAQALDADPATAAEQLRIDFRLVSSGEEAIPVDPALMLTASDPVVSDTPPEIDLTPWYFWFVELAASWGRLRQAMLVTSILLTLFAFTCLHESQAAWVMPLIRRGFRGLHGLIRRYTAEPAAPESAP